MSTAEMAGYDRSWWWLRLFLGTLVRVLLRPIVHGAEHVSLTGPLLLVSNHSSWWDIPAIGQVQPRTIRYMAKAGAGRCAVVEDADVVPVAIRGTRKWRPGRRVHITFGPPRRYERGDRRPAQAYRETADELMAEIRRMYEQTA